MTVKKPHDPLQRLDATVDAEAQALEQRFNAADRQTSTAAAVPAPRSPGGVIRASFSFPPNDHQLLDTLQERCLASGFFATKSELVRAGLHVLMELPDDGFARALSRVETLRRGPRPRRPDTP